MEYIAHVCKGKNAEYGVRFPDLPGCMTSGRTLEEARERAVEALMKHVAAMVERGEAVPEASTLDDLAGDEGMRCGVAVLVGAEAPEKTVRVNITARASQIEAIDRLAKQSGMTRSAYMVRSAVRAVPERREVGRG